MDNVDNNQFEIKPNDKIKRKLAVSCPNAYLNPALDILANDDPMCNNAMEIIPNKKRKRSKSCDVAVFENTALDVGISKQAVNEFLAKELENVQKHLRNTNNVAIQSQSVSNNSNTSSDNDKIIYDDTSLNSEPIYANTDTLKNDRNLALVAANKNNTDVCTHTLDEDVELDSGISILEQKSLSALNVANDFDPGNISAINKTSIHTNITNNVFINSTSANLSFLERLALDSPNISNQSLYLDDDLNESNIMEIKTITIITKKKIVPEQKKNTNPFLDPNLDLTANTMTGQNPFLNLQAPTTNTTEMEYQLPNQGQLLRQANHVSDNLIPRRLFTSDTNSTVSTLNDSITSDNHHEYENIDVRPESPIYENISDIVQENVNKQSKILGHDVTKFSALDIMNLNRNIQVNTSNESNESKTKLKNQILKASNKLSKKVFKTLKKKFKSEKVENNATLNPYEVPRKPPKKTIETKESGIENPALNLDNSDEIEIEELDDEEHQYETIKTLRNTQFNMNVTPLRERTNDAADVSQNRTQTPGKKVRFDSTLNQEKIITGNSFDYDIQSPGFDAKIDKYQDELENCINERKFLQQNM